MKKRILLVLAACLLALGCFFGCSSEETEPKYEYVTVSYNTYVNLEIPTQRVIKGERISPPMMELNRAGYTFVGWYNGAKKWDFSKNTVTENVTLTAKWEPYLSYVEDDGKIFVAGCDLNVTDVVVPSTYNGRQVEGILHYAFADRKNIKSVVIPSTVTVIGEGAFYGCTQLKTVYCEAREKPQGWNESIVNTDVEFVYGYKK